MGSQPFSEVVPLRVPNIRNHPLPFRGFPTRLGYEAFQTNISMTSICNDFICDVLTHIRAPQGLSKTFFMYLHGVDLFDRQDTDDNNGDDGVSKCRFTITVFLPPCNVSPVYLLPPNSPTLPYSLVSLNSHLIMRILLSRCLEEQFMPLPHICIHHICSALSHSSCIIKQGLEVKE